MEIRLDGSEIRIQVNSIDDCNNILDNNDILRIFINKLVIDRKESLIRQRSNYAKYIDWWNNKIVPELLTMTLIEDDKWKWGQLVKQEIDMWIRLDKPVGKDAIYWIADRRGFNSRQVEVLIEGLKLVELYSESNTIYPNDTLDKMRDSEAETLAINVGYIEE